MVSGRGRAGRDVWGRAGTAGRWATWRNVFDIDVESQGFLYSVLNAMVAAQQLHTRHLDHNLLVSLLVTG
jgi:hypothetical protein